MPAPAQPSLNMQIAQTILAQLGGNRFITMTGAKYLVAIDHGIQFQLPSRFALHGINYVKVELAPSDTYTITFGKVFKVGGMPEYKEHSVESLVYATELRSTFTRVTGLDTHL